MINVSIEVDRDTDCFTLSIQAESISRALSIAKEHHPDGRMRVIFPINPDQFFCDSSTARMVELTAAEVTE